MLVALLAWTCSANSRAKGHKALAKTAAPNFNKGLGAPPGGPRAHLRSPPFDRAIRHRFDARCRYDAKEETAEERSRRRRGGNAAAFETAREARVRKAREKANAVEAIRAARARRTRASGEEPDENDAPGTRATRDG